MLDLFIRARNVSTPILAIRSADQFAAVAAAIAVMDPQHPAFTWDAGNGLLGANDPGREIAKRKGFKPDDTAGFVDAMLRAVELPQSSVVFAYNAHRQLTSAEPLATAAAIQAVANLRDVYKRNFRLLALLCPSMQVPAEISQDVTVLDHELPDATRLAAVVRSLYGSANQAVPTDDTVGRAAEACSGLSEFAAEQNIALSFSSAGLDVDALWERKRVTIEQTPGLRVWRGRETFSDIVGMDSVKTRLKQRLRGRTRIGTVVVLDEIDKVMANVEHDTSGVRMDQFRTLLTEMENNEWEGILLAGMPGGGKTLVAKALGREAGVPTIMLDLAAMEGSLVGESEQRLRQAMAIIKAIGGGHAYFVATSNNATVMRPELQRRFTGGFFFVDLMTDEERAAAWRYYLAKYQLPDQPLPDDTAWTAAEIRNCAREAWNCNATLVEAARFIVPVAQARAPEFDQMRKEANGRFLDANRPGKYQYDRRPMERPLLAISLGDVAVGAALAGMRES